MLLGILCGLVGIIVTFRLVDDFVKDIIGGWKVAIFLIIGALLILLFRWLRENWEIILAVVLSLVVIFGLLIALYLVKKSKGIIINYFYQHKSGDIEDLKDFLQQEYKINFLTDDMIYEELNKLCELGFIERSSDEDVWFINENAVDDSDNVSPVS